MIKAVTQNHDKCFITSITVLLRCTLPYNCCDGKAVQFKWLFPC